MQKKWCTLRVPLFRAVRNSRRSLSTSAASTADELCAHELACVSWMPPTAADPPLTALTKELTSSMIVAVHRCSPDAISCAVKLGGRAYYGCFITSHARLSQVMGSQITRTTPCLVTKNRKFKCAAFQTQNSIDPEDCRYRR